MLGYFEEVLGKNIEQLEPVDVTKITRDGNVEELKRFATLVITLMVQCEQNQIYVEKIQQLDTPLQAELMFSIESVCVFDA
jgi:hypothetical protein